MDEYILYSYASTCVIFVLCHFCHTKEFETDRREVRRPTAPPPLPHPRGIRTTP
jgi:hypothetical protein